MDFLKQIFDGLMEVLRYLSSGSVAFNEGEKGSQRTAALDAFNTVTGATNDLLGLVRK